MNIEIESKLYVFLDNLTIIHEQTAMLESQINNPNDPVRFTDSTTLWLQWYELRTNDSYGLILLVNHLLFGAFAEWTHWTVNYYFVYF